MRAKGRTQVNFTLKSHSFSRHILRITYYNCISTIYFRFSSMIHLAIVSIANKSRRVGMELVLYSLILSHSHRWIFICDSFWKTRKINAIWILFHLFATAHQFNFSISIKLHFKIRRFQIVTISLIWHRWYFQEQLRTKLYVQYIVCRCWRMNVYDGIC